MDWSHDPHLTRKTKAKQDAQSGWKGRSAAMAALLRYHISFDEVPLELLLTLVDVLSEARLPKCQYTGKFWHALFAAHALARSNTDQILCLCSAALSAASVAIWYKALFEALLSIWDDNAQRLCSVSIGDPACESLLEVAGRCAQAFAALIQVTKHHRDKQVGALSFVTSHALEVHACTMMYHN